MINCAAWSPAGALFAAGFYDGSVRVWQSVTGKCLHTFSAGNGETIGLGFVTETRLITGNTLGKMRQWDIHSGAETLCYQCDSYDFFGVFALSLSRKLILAFDGSSSHLLNAETGSFIRTMAEDGLDAAISADDKYAVIEAGWGNVTLNRIADGRKIREFKPHTSQSPHAQVDISHDGQYVLSCPLHVYVWQADGSPVNTLTSHPVAAARFSPDCQLIACGGYEGVIVLWDFRANQEIRQFSGHSGEIYALEFSPDGNYLLTGSFDNTARIWDVNTGREVLRVEPD